MSEDAVSYAIYWAEKKRLEFITPELVLIGVTLQQPFDEIAKRMSIIPSTIREELRAYTYNGDVIDEGEEYTLESSLQLHQMLKVAETSARCSSKDEIDIPHIIGGVLSLDDSVAKYTLYKHFGNDDAKIISIFSEAYTAAENSINDNESYDGFDWLVDDSEDESSNVDLSKDGWKTLVTCMNDQKAAKQPFIGREEELERTIQILSRKDKNNPLHIGESGVGKTALIYGLISKIKSGDVPENLKNSKIYSMDLGSMIAGSQMRGEFEKRIKAVLEGVRNTHGGIIYLDEIHNLIGAGQIGDSAMDASTLLKPYLDEGTLRFIGSTTYQDYNRYMAKSKGIIRRFQQIDINEPSIDETIQIIKGVLPNYEKFHGVKYTDEAIRYAVEKSNQLIVERFLPDKAIDIIDEAGAYRKLHPIMTKNNTPKAKRFQTVDKQLISEILSKICKIDSKALKDSDNKQLEKLSERILSQIYGQDEAVRYVVEAVQMAKAGLLDENKPLASLLFVGPTGVGKTELCKVLANELGIQLIRFDMSEYTEKHTIAKLIGSPAGYVGYEDGGLLTDAIRKSPNCVLLLDEIEKAHSDIYNILLQVMDYARLTDNRGNKADFKNVILIMTSNAGAQFANTAGMGFASNTTRGDVMLQTVKKIFKPEFLNRLSGTVVFHDMDRTMAEMIFDKKTHQLEQRLNNKNVTLELMPEARRYFIDKGFTKLNGAREMDRVIQQHLNPLLMHEILFGKLQKGGIAKIDIKDNKLILI
jgi:ATP-dependent Clp protease ATP-binding subunit ClpA